MTEDVATTGLSAALVDARKVLRRNLLSPTTERGDVIAYDHDSEDETSLQHLLEENKQLRKASADLNEQIFRIRAVSRSNMLGIECQYEKHVREIQNNVTDRQPKVTEAATQTTLQEEVEIARLRLRCVTLEKRHESLKGSLYRRINDEESADIVEHKRRLYQFQANSGPSQRGNEKEDTDEADMQFALDNLIHHYLRRIDVLNEEKEKLQSQVDILRGALKKSSSPREESLWRSFVNRDLLQRCYHKWRLHTFFSMKDSLQGIAETAMREYGIVHDRYTALELRLEHSIQKQQASQYMCERVRRNGSCPAFVHEVFLLYREVQKVQRMHEALDYRDVHCIELTRKYLSAVERQIRALLQAHLSDIEKQHYGIPLLFDDAQPSKSQRISPARTLGYT